MPRLRQIMSNLPDLNPILDDEGAANPGALVNSLGYITALAGYIITLLTTHPLTLPGFLAFTAANILWFACFLLLTRSSILITMNQVHLLMIGLAVATFWAVALIFVGMSLDWLLPVVTIAVFMLAYPTRVALLFSSVIALGTMLMLLVASLGSSPSEILQNQLSLAPALLYAFTFPLFMRQQREQRERAEALVVELEAAQEQLQAHADQVEELAITRERNRMAREIHDTLGHYLTILAVQLETALKLEEHHDPRLHEELVEARRAAAESLAEVRRSVSALRPTDLARLTLTEALARLVREFESVLPETEIILDAEDDIDRLAPEVRVTLYRCVQEALTNIRKHAQATKVLVRLRVDGEVDTNADGTPDSGQVELTVLDNGPHPANGAKETPSGFGLQGIRERIALVGGSVAAGPEPGAGWRVEVRLPTAPFATPADIAPSSVTTGTTLGALVASGDPKVEAGQ
ncbi:MAG TPA: sensor histidine kinase [Ktedonobacterales bacterium]|nr:sensor histidine kinase [Ktedonobacterales bacterium]